MAKKLLTAAVSGLRLPRDTTASVHHAGDLQRLMLDRGDNLDRRLQSRMIKAPLDRGVRTSPRWVGLFPFCRSWTACPHGTTNVHFTDVPIALSPYWWVWARCASLRAECGSAPRHLRASGGRSRRDRLRQQDDPQPRIHGRPEPAVLNGGSPDAIADALERAPRTINTLLQEIPAAPCSNVGRNRRSGRRTSTPAISRWWILIFRARLERMLSEDIRSSCRTTPTPTSRRTALPADGAGSRGGGLHPAPGTVRCPCAGARARALGTAGKHTEHSHYSVFIMLRAPRAARHAARLPHRGAATQEGVGG